MRGVEGEVEEPTLERTTYFNSGLIVLKPSQETFQHLKTTLLNAKSLRAYLFADQDFLNEVYAGKWIRLSYVYNAFKTLRATHSEMWNDKDIRVVHHFLEKPWVNLKWPELPEEERREDPFFVLKTWWFEAHVDMIRSLS